MAKKIGGFPNDFLVELRHGRMRPWFAHSQGKKRFQTALPDVHPLSQEWVSMRIRCQRAEKSYTAQGTHGMSWSSCQVAWLPNYRGKSVLGRGGISRSTASYVPSKHPRRQTTARLPLPHIGGGGKHLNPASRGPISGLGSGYGLRRVGHDMPVTWYGRHPPF